MRLLLTAVLVLAAANAHAESRPPQGPQPQAAPPQAAQPPRNQPAPQRPQPAPNRPNAAAPTQAPNRANPGAPPAPNREAPQQANADEPPSQAAPEPRPPQPAQPQPPRPRPAQPAAGDRQARGQTAGDGPPARERALQGVVGDKRLAACFAKLPPERKVEMIVAITVEKQRLRSTIKQSKGSNAVIDKCVVRVFDELAVKLPSAPLARPIEIPVRYEPAAL